ncbi:hypothetical protein SEVIR_4G241900v4 [Setaria viridis]
MRVGARAASTAAILEYLAPRRDAEEPTGSGVVSCDPSRRRLEPPRPNSRPMWTAALVPWRRIHRPPGCSFLLSPGVSIPVVDLSLPAPVAAATATAEAARSWGFFHLVSHQQALAVPEDYPAQALAAVGAFNELPAAELRPLHGRRDPVLLRRRSVPDLRRELAQHRSGPSGLTQRASRPWGC